MIYVINFMFFLMFQSPPPPPDDPGIDEPAPIDDHLLIGLIVGLFIAFFYFRKMYQSKSN